jgi:antitoxin component of MazEF toxin-antitoxin module
MRLQKQVNRKVDDKEYAKYVVVVPPEEVQELGWQEGQELKPEVKGKKLIISPKESQR